MSSVFRAFAIDYDGTLASADRPSESALGVVRELREQGRVVVLVTGRILTELRADFPGVEHHFDAIVAENGAVLQRGASTWTLAPPVDEALARALRQRGIRFRRGQVILAADGHYAPVVYDEIYRRGLELQAVHNRGALMVLPHDVSKGSGIAACLADLGISPHNAVGIGDAENDHSLLDACEIGVAVGNAIDALKAHADLVLSDWNGEGVARFLRLVASNDLPMVEPRRWSVELGTYDDGTPAVIPTSRTSITINGESGSGKSYLAGLIAERLLRKQYAVCVLDLEGDHAGLRDLHGMVGLGGRDPLPPIHEVGELLRHGLDSLVIDLSMQSTNVKRTYARAVLEECRAAREATGRPHWVIVEEAHVPLGSHDQECGCVDAIEGGLCLVSYRPDLLCGAAAQCSSVVLTSASDGSVSLTRGPSREARRFTPTPRRSRHSRHAKKYVDAQLPVHRRFLFRDARTLTGRSAGNLTEFKDELLRAPPEVVHHHAANHDFSRWLADLSRDDELTREIRSIEDRLTGSVGPNGEAGEDLLIAAIVDRYAV